VAGRLAADKGGVPSQSVASGHRTPLQAVAVSEDATQLRATGQERNIAWCARKSVMEFVPEVCSTQGGASVVGLRWTMKNRNKSMKQAKDFAGSH
jgi:hypothetical protein